MKTISAVTACLFLAAATAFGEADVPDFIVNSPDAVEQLDASAKSAATCAESAPSQPLRGVMIAPGLLNDASWDTMADWGVTLVRYQVVIGTDGKPPTNHVAYTAAWRDGLEKAIGKLETALSQARKRGIKVCIDMHSWPGGRVGKKWGDPEEWGIDSRMFHDPFYPDLLVESWTNIVRRVLPYRDVIYGYDIVNEPNQNTPAAPGCDQVSVIKRAALAVRAIDPDTPIVVMAYGDSVNTLAKYTEEELGPLIHQFHIYRPHDFSHQGILTPLDRVEYWPNPAKGWTENLLRKYIDTYRDLQLKTGGGILVGEFSAMAWAPGAETYIRDCIALIERYGWDWTYHAFREWPGWSVEREPVFRSRNLNDFRESASNPRMRILKRGLVGKIAPWEAGAPIQARPFRRVMFCGNSITRHGPDADIGWTNDWGMAASAPERDYVHLLVRALEARSGVRSEFTIHDIPLEKDYGDAEKIRAAIDKAIQWHPDLVVLGYGENTHSVANDADESLFRAAYLETTRALCEFAGAEVVLLSPFWQNERLSRILSEVAEETGAIYVDIGDLGEREEMTAKGRFEDDGVAAHPGDAGMIAIFDRILVAIAEHLEAEEEKAAGNALP